MANLGRKYSCYSCHTKFYDLGKATPVCPKCGADQRDADEAPVVTSHRGRRVIEVVPEPEVVEEEAPPALTDAEEDEDFEALEQTEEKEADEEEDEEY